MCALLVSEARSAIKRQRCMPGRRGGFTSWHDTSLHRMGLTGVAVVTSARWMRDCAYVFGGVLRDCLHVHVHSQELKADKQSLDDGAVKWSLRFSVA